MEELLYQYNPWWEEDYNLTGVQEREYYLKQLRLHIENKSILFLTGLRRVGKTTLIKLLIKELIDKKVDVKKILYVSLDDYILRKNNIIEIVEEYRKILKIGQKEKVYLFFDEVTYKNSYQQQLKNLYDHNNVKIIATSSSSSLLKDKKAYLTGRAIIIEVKPLDFEEYLSFKGISVKRKENYLLESYFKDYIREGGMPENVINPNREYLMNLIDDIIQKDITAYHGLKNHQIARDYFTLLMERSGKQLSINKIGNILKISPDTSRRYLNYFKETYLVQLLPRWGKTNETLLSAKKIYASDLGIKYLFVGDRDIGSYFENYIYLKLKNRKDLYYLYENGTEIDFITSDMILIESKYNSQMNAKQEKLYKEFSAKRKIVIDSVKMLEKLEEL
ncbi:ATP-binding protein [bacterium]|nr:ATP-binding protein [bacterium]